MQNFSANCFRKGSGFSKSRPTGASRSGGACPPMSMDSPCQAHSHNPWSPHGRGRTRFAPPWGLNGRFKERRNVSADVHGKPMAKRIRSSHWPTMGVGERPTSLKLRRAGCFAPPWGLNVGLKRALQGAAEHVRRCPWQANGKAHPLISMAHHGRGRTRFAPPWGLNGRHKERRSMSAVPMERPCEARSLNPWSPHGRGRTRFAPPWAWASDPRSGGACPPCPWNAHAKRIRTIHGHLMGVGERVSPLLGA